MNRKTVLFLFRTYNDIDHIVPIAWKAAVSGISVNYIFAWKDFSDDYRIRYLSSVGAEMVENSFVNIYHNVIRKRVPLRIIRSLFDRIISYTLGSLILGRQGVVTIVNEWSGPVGNEMAQYFIRPARRNGIPVICVPHGHRIEVNWDMNETVARSVSETGKPPSLANRNLYTWYVVQNQLVKEFAEDSGIRSDKLKILGSARYCAEWQRINYHLCLSNKRFTSGSKNFRVAVFLRHWGYHIDRGACIELLEKISLIRGVELLIVGHTRGRDIGGLTKAEEAAILERKNTRYIGAGDQSPSVIACSDLIFCYGTSIAFEAIVQGVVICNPLFLTSNSTIFDGSGVVYDVESINEAIRFVHNQKGSLPWAPEQAVVNSFVETHLYGGNKGTDVLGNYNDLILDQVNSSSVV